MINRKALYLGILSIVGIIFAVLLTYIVYKIWKYIYQPKSDGSSQKIDILPSNIFFPPFTYTPVPGQEPVDEICGQNLGSKENRPKRDYNLLKDAKKAKPFEPEYNATLIHHSLSLQSLPRSDEDVSMGTTRNSAKVTESTIQGFAAKRNEEFRKYQMKARHIQGNRRSRKAIDLRGNSLTEEMFIDSINNVTSTVIPEPLSSSCESSHEENDISKKAGKIRFTTKYCEKEKKLQVRVIKAFDIAPDRDMDDIKPFVRVSLYPGKKQSQNTRVKKDATKEPFFNEIIIFQGLNSHDICTYKLKLKVCNHIRVRKKEVLGETELNLSLVNLYNEKEFTLQLHQAKREVTHASVILSVNHEFINHELCVIIHEAHVPKLGKHLSCASPYVTLELFKEDMLVTKKQTTTKRKTMGPLYNENFNFPLTLTNPIHLKDYSLLITVKHNGVAGLCKNLGHVTLGLNSKSESARQQWEKIVDVPDVPCKSYHSLLVSDDV